MEKDGIYPRIFKNDSKGTAVDVDAGADVSFHGRPEVDRISDRHPYGKEFLQRGPRRFCKVGDNKPLLFDEVGGDDARTAAKGEDRHPFLPGGGRFCEGECPAEVHHLLEVSRFEHPGLGQRAGDDSPVAGEGGRVTHRRFRPFPAPSSLEDDDRFPAAPTDIQEAPPIGKGFKIKADHPGVGIIDKVLQQVAFVDIDLVAHGADLAYAHRRIAHQIDQKDGGEHAALDHEGDGTGDEPLFLCLFAHKGEDVAVDHINKAHAVGSPDADSRPGGGPGEFLLEFGPFRTGFGKTARFNHDAGDAFRCALLHRRGNLCGGNEDDGEIHWERDGAYGGITGKTLDFSVVRIDGVNPPPVAEQKVFQDGVSTLQRIRGCPDDGYPPGVEEKIHVFLPRFVNGYFCLPVPSVFRFLPGTALPGP